MINQLKFTNRITGQSLEFNDDDISATTLNIDRQTRRQDVEKATEHGRWATNTYIDSLVVRCEGDILQDDAAGYNQKRLLMNGVLMPYPHMSVGSMNHAIVGDLDIIYDGIAEELTAECTIDGMPELPIEGLSPSRGRYMVNFLAFDPFWYGKTEQEQNAGTPGITSGRTYPKTYPKTYAAYTGGADVVLTNSGNYMTHVMAEITGPVFGPQLILLHMDGSTSTVQMPSLSLDTGEMVEVDFMHKTVVSDEGSNLYNYIEDTEWWGLMPGDNDVRFTAFSAGAGSGALFKWRNAYVI